MFSYVWVCFNHSPAQVAPVVQQKTDSTDGNDHQEYLLLRHLSLLHWDCVRKRQKSEVSGERKGRERTRARWRWNEKNGNEVEGG